MDSLVDQLDLIINELLKDVSIDKIGKEKNS
jgi:hypothetical protein